MITSEPPPVEGPAEGPAVSPPPPGNRPTEEVDSEGPVTKLRGAGVDIDPRRAGRAVVAVCLLALAVVAVILLIAGLEKNAQSDSLHKHGVPVAVTVDSCLGLLGGSGSNPAGYACKGTYTFGGHLYRQNIPGAGELRAGTVIRGIIVPTDPGLLSTPALVADQHASWRVFIAPVILLVVLALAGGALLFRHRRARVGRDPVGR